MLAVAAGEKHNRSGNVFTSGHLIHRGDLALGVRNSVEGFLAKRIAEPIRADKTGAYRIDADLSLPNARAKAMVVEFSAPLEAE